MREKKNTNGTSAHASAADDPYSRRLLAAYGTNERRQRTCRILGRGLYDRLSSEVLAHEVTKITCDFPAGDEWQDWFCTALVELEYGAYCCKSWSWLLVKADGRPDAERPFECVELGGDDVRLLERALRRMTVIEAEHGGPHG